jgi:hypothetical protein
VGEHPRPKKHAVIALFHPAASFRPALLPNFKASLPSDFGKVVWKTVHQLGFSAFFPTSPFFVMSNLPGSQHPSDRNSQGTISSFAKS